MKSLADTIAVGRCVEGEELGAGAPAGLDRVVAGRDQLLVEHREAPAHLVEIAAEPVLGGARILRPPDERDAAVAEFGQMLDRRRRAAAIVDADVVGGERAVAAVQHDEGHAALAQHHHLRAVGGGGGEDEPVEALVDEMVQIGCLLRLVVVGVAEHEVVVPRPQHVLHAAHQIGKEGVGDVGQQHADGPGALQPQAARQRRGAIAEPRGGGDHLVARLRPHIALAGERVRHGRRRHAAGLGDILDRYRGLPKVRHASRCQSEPRRYHRNRFPKSFFHDISLTRKERRSNAGRDTLRASS